MTLDIYNLLILSWTIQSAMALILLFAMFGIAVSFNRAAMRALMIGWAAFTALTFVELGGSIALTRDAGTPWLASVSAAALACIIMIVPCWLHAVDALAGVRRDPWPPARRVAPWAGAAVVAFAGIEAGIVTGRDAFYLAQPVLLTIVSTWLAAHAWRRSRSEGENPRLLRLLAFGIALMPARIAVTWIFRTGVELREQTTGDLALIVIGQLLQALATGIIIVVVMLGEERSATIVQEAQLRDAEARLLDARRFESLGRLASGVAHDFNNVLTVVTAGLESIRLGVRSTPDITEDLGMIESAIKRAGDLVRQLVTYAKGSEEGATTIDASARLRESFELLRTLAGRNVQLELEVPERAFIVAVRATRFDQVVQNLVVNARDAMPSGGNLTITAAEESRMPAHSVDGTPREGGPYLRLAFADTGGGIPDDVLPHIFEPFFSTKSGSGSGLGLATVQRIVREAKGDVIASSEVPRGTRFEVFLPLLRGAPAGSTATA